MYKIIYKKIMFLIMIVIIILLGILNSKDTKMLEGKDISENVSISRVNIKIKHKGIWYDVIKDGVEVANHPNLEVYQDIKFMYKWQISEKAMSNISTNDYFKIKLPDHYFKFNNLDFEYPILDENNKDLELGKWSLKDNNIIATLNENGASKNSIDKGYFDAVGKIDKEGNNINIIVPGLVLPPIHIDPAPNVSEEEHDEYGYLNKHGEQVSNNDKIHWGMFVNYTNYKKAYEFKSFEKLENVMLSDDLDEGMEIDEDTFEIATKLHVPTSDNKMSSMVVGWIRLNNKFDKITQLSNETYDEFYQRISSNIKPAYGIYNKNRLLVNFKNLNGEGEGIKLNNLESDVELKTNLQNKVNANEITQVQADKMFASYSQQSAAKGDVLGFIVNFDTNVNKGNGQYKNTAKLSFNNRFENSNEVIVNFQEIIGGASAGEPGSLIIEKSDGDTHKKLKGVGFKLLKKDINNNYVEYTPRDGIINKQTDSDGKVIFNQLHNGSYKIIETYQLEGYSNKVRFVESEYFSIDGNETKAINVSVYNFKDPTEVLINKLDADTNKQLKGAVFNLYKSEGTIYKRNLISNKSGKININGLYDGEYYIKEVMPPKDYKLSKKQLKFKIKRDGRKITFDFYNKKKINKTRKISKTGESNILIILILIGFICILHIGKKQYN